MDDRRFLVDAVGEFGPDRVRLVWRNEPRPAHPELDELIERTWNEQLAAAERKGTMLFNGLLARYLRHRVREGRLDIDVGPSDYRAFIGTNFYNYHRGEEFGWDLFSNPVGTSAVISTADGWLLFGRRNQRVACHAGYVHTFGGGLEADERLDDGTYDAFASIMRELEEELGLRPEDVHELVCLGLIRDPQIRQPELIFDARVASRRDEVEARFDPDAPGGEHAAIVCCRDERDAILPFLQDTELVAPVAEGGILLHGRRRFGDAWYQQALVDL